MEASVLVGVLRTARDREILLREGWYRIPCRRPIGDLPAYLAFYQGARSGARKPGIAFYARVKGAARRRRISLFPGDKGHPRARDWYWRFALGPVRRLPRVVRNLSRTRVSFIRTDLGSLRRAREMRELLGIPPLEEIAARLLAGEGIAFRPQFIIAEGGRCRYRLDFALFPPGARIAVECDHGRWHRRRSQRERDRRKDRWLERRGWTVLRFDEDDLLKRPAEAVRRIRAAAGLKPRIKRIVK